MTNLIMLSIMIPAVLLLCIIGVVVAQRFSEERRFVEAEKAQRYTAGGSMSFDESDPPGRGFEAEAGAWRRPNWVMTGRRDLS